MIPRRDLRLVSTPPKLKAGLWPALAPPVMPAETDERIRAQSILSGPLIGACPTLSLDQARDVLRWATGFRSKQA